MSVPRPASRLLAGLVLTALVAAAGVLALLLALLLPLVLPVLWLLTGLVAAAAVVVALAPAGRRPEPAEPPALPAPDAAATTVLTV